MTNEHDERIAQIKARRGLVTGGRWHLSDEPELPFARHSVVSEFEALKPDVGSMKAYIPVAYFAVAFDGDFITHAPADMTWLLEYVAKLEADLDAARDTVAALLEGRRG